VQGIRGLISYEGQNVDELEQDFRAGIDEYLEVCKEKGIEPQNLLQVHLMYEYLLTHMYSILKAQELGINLNAFVKSAIEEKLQTTSVTMKRKK
jgi:predicted HicB family RNase H-like nuclease